MSGRHSREIAGSDVPPRGQGVKREVLKPEDLSAKPPTARGKATPPEPKRPSGYRGKHEGRG